MEDGESGRQDSEKALEMREEQPQPRDAGSFAENAPRQKHPRGGHPRTEEPPAGENPG